MAPRARRSAGDLVAIDVDGLVTYHGRGDEMLKVGGRRLAPQEVEGCLLEHPGVAEAAVVGVPDPTGLSCRSPMSSSRRSATALVDELMGFVAERLPAHKRPRALHIVATLAAHASRQGGPRKTRPRPVAVQTIEICP